MAQSGQPFTRRHVEDWLTVEQSDIVFGRLLAFRCLAAADAPESQPPRMVTTRPTAGDRVPLVREAAG
jgi:hypothetical protein